MKVTKEQAEEILKVLPEMAEQIYEVYPELKPSKVVDSWEDLEEISGYYIDESSDITKQLKLINNAYHKNIFKTQKQAESALAYAQLTQLMADCGDCDVDWEDYQTKYCIRRIDNLLEIVKLCRTFDFLAFTTPEIALEFMQKHEELIETFYQL